MPFLAIAFPVFDPIAISLGPIAIRWYALAYIAGPPLATDANVKSAYQE